MSIFNEIRDRQHAISRKRDGLVKKNLAEQERDKNKNPSKNPFIEGIKVRGRLVGKPSDNIFVQQENQDLEL